MHKHAICPHEHPHEHPTAHSDARTGTDTGTDTDTDTGTDTDTDTDAGTDTGTDTGTGTDTDTGTEQDQYEAKSSSERRTNMARKKTNQADGMKHGEAQSIHSDFGKVRVMDHAFPEVSTAPLLLSPAAQTLPSTPPLMLKMRAANCALLPGLS